MIDWSSCPAVERDPERVSGTYARFCNTLRGLQVT